MNGFLNINKPAGMSSAAVVAVIRRLSGEKRVGHAGTLDPEAAGILPVMIGKATRLFDFLADKEKEYVTVAAFGTGTDTQDFTGTVVQTGDRYPDRALLEEKLPLLTGDIRQRPSVYSAVKVNGQRLYAMARRGEAVEVPERTVHVESIRILREMPDHGWELHVQCGRGTYIRSICHDLGQLCGCPAHMRSLTRTRSGPFTLDTALDLEEAKALSETGTLKERLLPMDYPLGNMPRAEIAPRFYKSARAGAVLPAAALDGLPEEEGIPVRAYLDGVFWGIGMRRGSEWTWRAVLSSEKEEA